MPSEDEVKFLALVIILTVRQAKDESVLHLDTESSGEGLVPPANEQGLSTSSASSSELLSPR